MKMKRGERKFPERDLDIYHRGLSGQTFKSIGEHYGLSPERVRNIYHRLSRQVLGLEEWIRIYRPKWSIPRTRKAEK